MSAMDAVPTFEERPLEAFVQDILRRFHWFMDVPPEYLHNMVCKEPPGRK